jgi:hypothetical protein
VLEEHPFILTRQFVQVLGSHRKIFHAKKPADPNLRQVLQNFLRQQSGIIGHDIHPRPIS